MPQSIAKEVGGDWWFLTNIKESFIKHRKTQKNRFKKGFTMEDNTQNNTNIRKCVTAVVYDNMHKPYFLILKRRKNWEGWEFIKGGVKEAESEVDAVKREIIEETGLQEFKIIKKIEGITKEYIGIGSRPNIHSIYLIESNMNIPIHIQKGEGAEHNTYLWTDAESVMSKLTWDSDKEILKKVLEEIE